MENKNAFDNYEFRLLPQLNKVARSIGHNICRLFTNLPEQPFASHGDHFRNHVANRGAEAMLAQTMDQEGTAYDPNQLGLWD